MLCSGCGKDIPFVGDVCPYCNRDKTADQSKFAGCLAPIITPILFSILGGLVSEGAREVGMWIGLGLGILFMIGTFSDKNNWGTKPPEVTITNLDQRKIEKEAEGSPKGKDSVQERLSMLNSLLQSGLITQDEFEKKRGKILDDI